MSDLELFAQAALIAWLYLWVGPWLYGEDW
jgi:hypothetical protein